MTMALYICPGCEREVIALAGSNVTHECPKRRNKLTEFKRNGPIVTAPRSVP